MDIILVIIIIAAVVTFIIKFKLTAGNSPGQDSSRPSFDLKPFEEKLNDKLVVVKNADPQNLRIALNAFCNIYNKESYQAIIKLTKISDREFALTFPYDIKFVTFCFLINYIKYPSDIEWKPGIAGWTTAKSADKWISKESADKKVLLFVPDDDDEYDNVFMTTEDNMGYKLGFGAGDRKRLRDTPRKKYFAPTIDINTLNGKQTEIFQ